VENDELQPSENTSHLNLIPPAQPGRHDHGEDGRAGSGMKKRLATTEQLARRAGEDGASLRHGGESSGAA
jgi:hypothetical protein